jgi:acyl dehydratase
VADPGWEKLIGARSAPVRNVIEAGAVRRFAEAIGDPDPIFLDDEYAGRTRWGRRIAPPTFSRVLDYGAIEGLRLPASGIIHGEQSYRYSRPLFVGEEVACHTLFADTFRKRGREGELTFLVFERAAESLDGEAIMRTREVYILTEKVLATLQRRDRVAE